MVKFHNKTNYNQAKDIYLEILKMEDQAQINNKQKQKMQFSFLYFFILISNSNL